MLHPDTYNNVNLFHATMDHVIKSHYSHWKYYSCLQAWKHMIFLTQDPVMGMKFIVSW